MKDYFKNLISVPEMAKILKISREAVLKQINKGKLIAKKVGRNYVIYKAGWIDEMS
jgi:excisionase family DNA binding protein